MVLLFFAIVDLALAVKLDVFSLKNTSCIIPTIPVLGLIQVVRRWKAVVSAMNKHPLDMRF
jgi:hypothetical protein